MNPSVTVYASLPPTGAPQESTRVARSRVPWIRVRLSAMAVPRLGRRVVGELECGDRGGALIRHRIFPVRQQAQRVVGPVDQLDWWVNADLRGSPQGHGAGDVHRPVRDVAATEGPHP